MKWFGVIGIFFLLNLIERVTVISLKLPKESWGVFLAMFLAYALGGLAVILFSDSSD